MQQTYLRMTSGNRLPNSNLSIKTQHRKTKLFGSTREPSRYSLF